jgi:AraC-like DNA-binding protein
MKIRILHRNEAIVVREVRCGGGPRGLGPEEDSPVDELVLVRAGLFVRAVGRERVVADATRVLFFRRGESYRTAHPTGEGDVCTTIELTAEGPLPPSAPTPPALDLAHRRLVSRLSRRALSPLEADEAVERLIGGLLSHGRRAPADATIPRRHVVDEARGRIAARFAEALRLHEVAREVGCSPFHLCREFRRATGLTMGRLQARLRVRAALERLSDGERDLTRLALELGFYDHSHLCRVFRREAGCSPSAWRASNFVQAAR